MNKLQSLFKKIVKYIEEYDLPFGRYIVLFFSILTIRLGFEFFSSKRLFTADDILHIGLWFIFIVLSFLVQLHFFSKEKILKVAKLVIVCFSISLTAPIIDLIFTNGKGAKMNYLSLNTWKDIIFSYFTIGGSSLTRGATLGIRIEIILLLIASFNYVSTKRKSIFWGLLSAFVIYTVLFLSGAIPLILGSIIKSFKLNYQYNDNSTILILLLLDIILLLLCFYRYASSVINLLIKKTAFLTYFLPIPLFILGSTLGIVGYKANWQLNPTTLFWFPLLAILYFIFCLYHTLLFKKNVFSFKNLNVVKNIFIGLVLVISSLISIPLFFICTILLALFFLLYEEPLQLYKYVVVSSVLKGLLLLSITLAGFVFFKAPMIGFPSNYLFAILGGTFLLDLLFSFKFFRKG